MKPLKQAFSWLKQVLGIGIGFIANYSQIAVTIVENLKKIVDGQLDNKFSNLFPKMLPASVVSFLERVAPIVLIKVSKIHGLLHTDWQGKNGQEILDEIVPLLRQVEKNRKSPFLADMAAHIGFRLADGRYSLDEIWDDCQAFYHRVFKRK